MAVGAGRTLRGAKLASLGQGAPLDTGTVFAMGLICAHEQGSSDQQQRFAAYAGAGMLTVQTYSMS